MKSYIGFIAIFAVLFLFEKVNCGSAQVGERCSNNNDCFSLNCDGGNCGLGNPGAPCNSINDCLNVDPEVACVGDLKGNNKKCHA
ncbi:hypothetical protein F8M41_000695 [Gigaspora margarita]|uniref:Uncharacterized protein n=1 Tax=Gigaspora margarita TaxID=4874 RepID=A0A8H4AAR2_GIGMA|nr:hypothetical protein F8M41_000695 [Gigaspora margarita]